MRTPIQYALTYRAGRRGVSPLDLAGGRLLCDPRSCVPALKPRLSGGGDRRDVGLGAQRGQRGGGGGVPGQADWVHGHHPHRPAGVQATASRPIPTFECLAATVRRRPRRSGYLLPKLNPPPARSLPTLMAVRAAREMPRQTDGTAAGRREPADCAGDFMELPNPDRAFDAWSVQRRRPVVDDLFPPRLLLGYLRP